MTADLAEIHRKSDSRFLTYQCCQHVQHEVGATLRHGYAAVTEYRQLATQIDGINWRPMHELWTS